VELEDANAEIARLSEAVKELAVKLTLLEGTEGPKCSTSASSKWS